MPYQPTNPYPHNTGINIEEGLQFKFKVDDYDTIERFKVDLYDLATNEKIYTVDRFVENNIQRIIIYDENETILYDGIDNRNAELPIKGGLGKDSYYIFDLSDYIKPQETIEYEEYYYYTSEVREEDIASVDWFTYSEPAENGVYITGFSSEEVIMGVDEEGETSEELSSTALVFPYKTNEGHLIIGIAAGAFKDSEDERLQNIVIPANYYEIQDYAFKGSSLTNIAFNYGLSKIGNEVFSECKNLQAIKLPNSLSELGEACFMGCTKLKNCILSNQLKVLKNRLFENCSGLISLTIPNSIEDIEYYEDKTNCIGKGILSGCVALQTLELPFIGKNKQQQDKKEFSLESNLGYLFYTEREKYYENENDTNLISVEGYYQIFYRDLEISVYFPQLLQTIKINNSVKIPYGGFRGSHVSEILLGEKIIDIESYAFCDVTGIQRLSIPKNIRIVKEGCFQNTEEEKAQVFVVLSDSTVSSLIRLEKIISNFNSIIFNGEIIEIEDCAFKNLNWLNKLNIYNNKIKKIGSHAFYNCDLLSFTEEAFFENVEELGDYAFYNCNGLMEVNLKEFMVYIGNNVFEMCSNLEFINLPSKLTNNKIGKNILKGASSLKKINFSFEYIPETSLITIKNDKSLFAYFFDSDGFDNIKVPLLNASELNIKGDYEKIPAYAFYKCFPASRTIDENSYEDLIININVVNSINNIGNYAFYNCSALQSFVLPDSNLNIGLYSFANCSTTDNTLTVFCYIRKSDYPCLGGSTNPTEENNKTCFKSSEKVILKGYQYKDDITETIENQTLIYKFCNEEDNNLKFESIAGKCGDNLKYSIDNETLIIEVIDENIKKYDMYDYSSTNCSPWYNQGSKIKQINLPIQITHIGNYAFKYIGLNEKLDLSSCESLNNIGNYAFYGCDNLSDIVFPSGLKSIGGHAFKSCDNLKSITFKSENVKLNEGCFAYCRNLIGIQISNSAIENLIPSQKINNEDNNEKLEQWIFQDCHNLKEIKIPEGIKTIGNCCFCRCYALNNINLPSSLETIDTSAFSNCTELKELQLPTSLTTINARAFADCNKLTNVDLSNTGVTKIDTGVFVNCNDLILTVTQNVEIITANSISNIKKLIIEINKNNSNYDNTVFYPVLDKNCGVVNCDIIGSSGSMVDLSEISTLKEIVLDNSSILPIRNKKQLQGCVNLKKLTLKQFKGNNLTDYFGGNVNNCYLNTITTKISSIPEEFFCGSSTLKNLNIECAENSENVEINHQAFYANYNLENVIIDEKINCLKFNGYNTISHGYNTPKNIFLNCKYIDVNEENFLGTNIYINDISQWLNSNFRKFYTYGPLKCSTLFVSNNKLTSLIVPNSVTLIPSYAFKDYSLLKSIDLNGVTSIGNYAFENCVNLTKITIPNSINEIKGWAFAYCKNLQAVNFEYAINFPNIESDELYLGDRCFYYSPFSSINLTGRNVVGSEDNNPFV